MITCDNEIKEVYVGGQSVNVSSIDNAVNWRSTGTVSLPAGTTSIAVKCWDYGVIAGILASSTNGILTNDTWKCSATMEENW